MNEIDVLRKLASASRAEPAPAAPDVADSVLRGIAARRGGGHALLGLAAAGACAAGLLLALLAWQDWAAGVDPFNSLFVSITGVMQ